jgi:hypothetical protein
MGLGSSPIRVALCLSVIRSSYPTPRMPLTLSKLPFIDEKYINVIMKPIERKYLGKYMSEETEL